MQGKALQVLGIPAALACSSAITAAMMLGVALHPSPSMVALTELLRKVAVTVPCHERLLAMPHSLCLGANTLHAYAATGHRVSHGVTTLSWQDLRSQLHVSVTVVHCAANDSLSHATQISTYTLTKPARELLFTPITPREKLAAKLCIDTLILRLGDGLAAGLFQTLHSSGLAGGCKPC